MKRSLGISNPVNFTAATVGYVLEWYDLAIYGFLAAIIGKHFFPADDPTASLLASFGVFALGFLARPLDGVLFGHIGDKIGRKTGMLISIGLMGGRSSPLKVVHQLVTTASRACSSRANANDQNSAADPCKKQ